jgi:hypothetical protein
MTLIIAALTFLHLIPGITHSLTVPKITHSLAGTSPSMAEPALIALLAQIK